MSFGGFGSSTGSGFSFGGFGQSQPASQPAFGSTSLFGASSAPATSSTFSFGAAPASSSSFSLSSTFGSSQPSSSSGFNFGSFGSSSAIPQQQQQQTQQPAFGFGSFGSSGSSLTSSSFGSFSTPSTSSTSLFGPAPNQSAAPALDSSATTIIQRQLTELRTAYDPSSPHCHFQSIFYNRIPPSASPAAYAAPPHANPALWQRAIRNNPEPARLTPTLAVGFGDLKKRREAQERARAVQQEALAAVRRSVDDMRAMHVAVTRAAVERLREQRDAQTLRLLQLVNRLTCIEAKRMPLVREEVDYRSKVEGMAALMQREGWMERVKELERRVRLTAVQAGGGMGGGASVDVQLSVEDREKLRVILDTQTRALEFLMDVVKEDRKALEAAAADGDSNGTEAMSSTGTIYPRLMA